MNISRYILQTNIKPAFFAGLAVAGKTIGKVNRDKLRYDEAKLVMDLSEHLNRKYQYLQDARALQGMANAAKIVAVIVEADAAYRDDISETVKWIVEHHKEYKLMDSWSDHQDTIANIKEEPTKEELELADRNKTYFNEPINSRF